MRVLIKQYIEQYVEELKDKVYPLFTTDVGALSAFYNVRDVGKDHVNTSQYTVTVAGVDYDECNAVAEKVADVLGKKSSETFIKYENLQFYSTLSGGGGELFNDAVQMYEISKIFIIKWRKV